LSSSGGWRGICGSHHEKSSSLSAQRLPNEGQGTVIVTIQLLSGDAHPHNPLLGSATAGSDFGGPMTFTLAIPAGQASSNEVQIPLLNDNIPEGDETFWAKVKNVQGGNWSGGIGSQGWAELYIVNSSLIANDDYVEVSTDDQVPLHLRDNDTDSAGSETFIDSYTTPQYGTITPVVNPETGKIIDLLFQRDPAHAGEEANLPVHRQRPAWQRGFFAGLYHRTT
jgi:hypothetical protein